VSSRDPGVDDTLAYLSTERTEMPSIQKLRLQRGWSQAQLAEASGLSARTVQRLESGQPASTESLKSLAAVFEVEFSTLQQEPAVTQTLTSTERDAERQEAEAFAHVRKLRGFYFHLFQYLVVNSVLLAINLITTPHRLWVIWPIFGWGIGLMLHASRVFRPDWILGARWERRQVERQLGRSL
jgi:transcriptional regulator with XRE-family HTH domain